MSILSLFKKQIHLIHQVLKENRGRKNRIDPTLIALQEAIVESKRIADKLESLKSCRQVLDIADKEFLISTLTEKQGNESEPK